MSSCDTCNQPVETRWPHMTAQEPCPCTPLGRVVTGHNVPAGDDIRLDSNYYMPASPTAYYTQRYDKVGKVQTGRKEHAPKMEAPNCQRYLNERLAPTERLVDPCGPPQAMTAAAPASLPFDTGSLTIGILLGLFGGVFVWTVTGRTVCKAFGMKCARSLG